MKHSFVWCSVGWLVALLMIGGCFDWNNLPTSKACVPGGEVEVCEVLGMVCVALAGGGGECRNASTQEPTDSEPPRDASPADTDAGTPTETNEPVTPELPDTPIERDPRPELPREQPPEASTPQGPFYTPSKNRVTFPSQHPCATNPSGANCTCIPSHMTHVFGRMHPGTITQVKVILPSSGWNLNTPISDTLVVTADDVGNIKLWRQRNAQTKYTNADTKRAFPKLAVPNNPGQKVVGLHVGTINKIGKTVYGVVSVTLDGFVRVWEIVPLGSSYELSLMASKKYTSTRESVTSSIWAWRKSRIYLGFDSGRLVGFGFNPKAQQNKLSAGGYFSAPTSPQNKPIIGLSLHPDYDKGTANEILLSVTEDRIWCWNLGPNFSDPTKQPSPLSSFVPSNVGFGSTGKLAFVSFWPKIMPVGAGQKTSLVLAFGTNGQISLSTLLRNTSLALMGTDRLNVPNLDSASAIAFSEDLNGLLVAGKNAQTSGTYRIDLLELVSPKNPNAFHEIRASRYWTLRDEPTTLTGDASTTKKNRLFFAKGKDVVEIDTSATSGNTLSYIEPFKDFALSGLDPNDGSDELGLLAITPNRRWLVSASSFGWVAVWDLETMERLVSWRAANQGFVSIGFAADGRSFLAINKDRQAAVIFAQNNTGFTADDWRALASTSLPLVIIPTLKDAGEVSAVHLHPEFSDLLAIGTLQGLAALFQVVKGSPNKLKRLLVVNSNAKSEGSAVDAIAFGRNGQVAASLRFGSIKLYKWNQKTPSAGALLNNNQGNAPLLLSLFLPGTKQNDLLFGKKGPKCEQADLCHIRRYNWNNPIAPISGLAVDDPTQNHSSSIISMIAHPLGNWLMTLGAGGAGTPPKKLLWKPDARFQFGANASSKSAEVYKELLYPLSEPSTELIQAVWQAGVLATATKREIRLWRCDTSQDPL